MFLIETGKTSMAENTIADSIPPIRELIKNMRGSRINDTSQSIMAMIASFSSLSVILFLSDNVVAHGRTGFSASGAAVGSVNLNLDQP